MPSVFVVLILTGAIAHAAAPTLQQPDWLPDFPQARDQAHAGSAFTLESSYTALAIPMVVIGHYEAQLRKAGIVFRLNADATGKTILAAAKGTSCVVRIAEADSRRAREGKVLRESPEQWWNASCHSGIFGWPAN